MFSNGKEQFVQLAFAQFTDGQVTVDLLTIASPHADEMLVPVIASDGLVYVADVSPEILGRGDH